MFHVERIGTTYAGVWAKCLICLGILVGRWAVGLEGPLG